MPRQSSGYQAYGAYARAAQPTQDPRQIEGWALLEAARRMADAAQSGDLEQIQVRNRIRDALRLNLKLWTLFQAELSSETTQVPEEIRINMLTLCRFVDQHSAKLLSEPTIEGVVDLINVNRHIGAGLLGVGEDGQVQQAPAGSASAAEVAPAALQSFNASA